jgi:hypothetical protein
MSHGCCPGHRGTRGTQGHCWSHQYSYRLWGSGREDCDLTAALEVSGKTHVNQGPPRLASHSPSSGSSLAQVSADMRLAMKWWPRALAADTGMVLSGLGPARVEEATRGSGRDSLLDSMLSRWTWAVLRGWRSFCTAGEAGRVSDHCSGHAACLSVFPPLAVPHLPSWFMPACRHFFNRQAWHWLRWALSTGHIPAPT